MEVLGLVSTLSNSIILFNDSERIPDALQHYGWFPSIYWNVTDALGG